MPVKIVNGAKELAEFVGEIPGQVAKRVAFEVFRRVIILTPVDTGRMRQSWRLTVDAIDPSVAPEADYKSQSPAFALPPTEGGKFSKWFVTNNLPYADVIDKGRIGGKGSHQAPAGITSVILAEIPEITERVLGS